ncbi:MAG: trigger factor [Nitrospirota bacterium]
MKVDIEEINSVKKILMIEIDDSVVKEERESLYSELNKRVKIQGFRQGRIPLYMLEKRYGKEVEGELVKKLVPQYFVKAIEENNIKPVESPTIEDVELRDDSSLTFKSTVEVKPEIELKDYREIGSKIKRRNITVSEEDVEKGLRFLQEQHGQLHACEENEKIERTSYVIIDYSGYIDGKPVEDIQQKDYLFQLNSNRFIPEIEEELIGKKKGDEIEKMVTLSPDFHIKEIAGKEINFKVKINEVKKKVLQDIDNDFAREIGDFATLDELKAKIRESLEVKLKREERLKEKEMVIKELISLHSFELPSSLVERETKDIVRHLKSASNQDESRENSAEDVYVKEEYKSLARERVMGRLILEAIAEKEKIEVKEEEIEEEINTIARENSSTPEHIKKTIINNEGSLDGLKGKIIEDKIVDLIFSNTIY